MDNIASNVVRWTVRFTNVIFIVTAFILVFNMMNGMLKIGLDTSLFGELMGLVQMWLPWNLGEVFAWITTAAGLIIGYYLYSWALKLVNSMIG